MANVPSATTTENVRDDVVTLLNTPIAGTSWAVSFTAAAMLFPKWDTDTLASLQVGVVAIKKKATRFTRATLQRLHAIGIFLQQQLASDAPTQLTQQAANSLLAQQIQDYFMARGFAQGIQTLAQASGPFTLTNCFLKESVVEFWDRQQQQGVWRADMFSAVVTLTWEEHTNQ